MIDGHLLTRKKTKETKQAEPHTLAFLARVAGGKSVRGDGFDLDLPCPWRGCMHRM